MHARVNTLQGSPESVQEAIRSVNERIIPAARDMAGYRGTLLLVDRSTGKALGITLWESEEAMRDSEEAAEQLRQQAAQAGEGQVVSVERYEIALDERL